MEEKRNQDQDRARYKKDMKAPTPINAKQPENFLLQLVKFEAEARGNLKKGRELWELFRTAVKDERAGVQLKAVMEMEAAKDHLKTIASYAHQPETQEALYEKLYSWFRTMIYVRMGGTPKAMKTHFRASWQETKLPHRQTRDDVEAWLVDIQNQ